MSDYHAQYIYASGTIAQYDTYCADIREYFSARGGEDGDEMWVYIGITEPPHSSYTADEPVLLAPNQTINYKCYDGGNLDLYCEITITDSEIHLN